MGFKAGKHESGSCEKQRGYDLSRKKKLLWHTTFGEITVSEKVFLKDGCLVRPFSEHCGIRCRGYSLPLQRIITDFGADVSFCEVPDKLREHYGITVGYSAIRNITEKHAGFVNTDVRTESEIPETDGDEYIITETDGSMIPTVGMKAGVESSDGRKKRECRWQEARLVMTHPKGSVSSVFGCTLGSTDETGDIMLSSAIRSGMGQKTEVHCVGDGATWIAEQTDRVFGGQGSFLIDFYHLCDYLSDASGVCSPSDPDNFFNGLKCLVKEGGMTEAVSRMRPCIEPASVPDNKAPVRRCIRYITNRPGQFRYKEAEEKGLPVGSGEIESAHRYIVQSRLKIPGAWWKENNAQNMLSLRVLRANGDWESYWKKAYRV